MAVNQMSFVRLRFGGDVDTQVKQHGGYFKAVKFWRRALGQIAPVSGVTLSGDGLVIDFDTDDPGAFSKGTVLLVGEDQFTVGIVEVKGDGWPELETSAVEAKRPCEIETSQY